MYFQIGWLTLGKAGDVDPGPKNADWHKVNVVVKEEIPGKGKKTVTIRTSDGTLDECTLTVRTVTDTRYKLLKLLCDQGGPFEVVCNHGTLWMYIIDRNINHTENDKEKPLVETDTSGESSESVGSGNSSQDDRAKLNVSTWTIQLLEAND